MGNSHIDLESCDQQGYLVVANMLDPDKDLQPVIEEYKELLNTLALGWYKIGDLSKTFDELPFNQRLIQIAIETKGAYYPYLDISFTQTTVSGELPMHHGPAVFDLLRNPRLLNVVEQFIGPEIYSNPVQHVRIKPPESALPNDMLTDASVGYLSLIHI